MKQISIHQFVLRSEMVSARICKKAAICFLVLMSIVTLLVCSVKTFGQSPKRFANDEIKVKIYKSGVAKQEQSEVKLKAFIDKELIENHYVDYIVLYQCDVTYRIKFFKTIQDKYAFIRNIQNNNYLDSLKNDTKCQEIKIVGHVYLCKSNNLALENITNSKLLASEWNFGANFTLAKGGGKYFLIMNCASPKKVFGADHILNVNLNNGAKIQLSPFTNFISQDKNNTTVLFTNNPQAFSNYKDPGIKILNSAYNDISYILQGFIYQLNLEQVKQMSNSEISSISLSADSKESINADNVQSAGFIKNDAKYIIDN